MLTRSFRGFCKATEEPRFNEPLHNEVIGIPNNILRPAKVTVKCMEQNLEITNLDITKSTL